MKVVLTIAGSDSSGGAGIQADLKTFEAFGVFGTSVITVLTAQNTQGVRDIMPCSVEFIKNQLNAVLDDFEVSAIKIGMLFSKEIMEVVLEAIKPLNIPIVLDPVYISKAGSSLMKEEDGEYLKNFFQHVSLITPNIYEAKELFGYIFGDSDSLKYIQSLKTPVVIKNERLNFRDELISVDQLFLRDKKLIFQTPSIETTNLHGTGCSYSSAIAANLALGKTVEESVECAKNFIYRAIGNAPNIGKGFGPINHKKGYEKC